MANLHPFSIYQIPYSVVPSEKISTFGAYRLFVTGKRTAPGIEGITRNGRIEQWCSLAAKNFHLQNLEVIYKSPFDNYVSWEHFQKHGERFIWSIIKAEEIQKTKSDMSRLLEEVKADPDAISTLFGLDFTNYHGKRILGGADVAQALEKSSDSPDPIFHEGDSTLEFFSLLKALISYFDLALANNRAIIIGKWAA
ncbi:MAG: hypothetical protein JO002_07480 [Burkholderiaceae bacterium]|nr:hypothetical protein [Burkholderiaceae bacterium]